MLPPTHFLAGLFFGLLGFKFGWINLWQAFLAAILAVALDIDHVYTYIKKKGKFDKDGWNKSIAGHDWSLWTFLHHWPAFFVINLLSLALAILLPSYAYISYIIAAAYTPHILLDRIYKRMIKNRKGKIIKPFGFVFHFYAFELWFDLVFLIGIILILSTLTF